MAQPRPGRGAGEEPSPRWAFAGFAVGGGLLLWAFKLISDHWFWPVALSFLLIGGYGFFFLWDRHAKRPSFDHAGDNLYYVGFLYTLISLAVSLFRFTGDGYTEGIVQGFGVALSSTVFGLIGRVLMSQPALDGPAVAEARSRQDLVAAHRELRAQMDYSIEDYKRFREDLRELWRSSEKANVAASEKLQALAGEAGRLDEIHGLGSRLEAAAEDAVRGMSERQEALAVRLEETASTALREIASQQETILAAVAARQDESAVRLEEAAASVARAITGQGEVLGAAAAALSTAVDESLKSFRALDFGREVGDRVLDPAAVHLRELIDGFQPLVAGLATTQKKQDQAVEGNREVVRRLERVLARNQGLAGGYQATAASLAQAAEVLASLPPRFEEQTERSEAALRRVTAVERSLRAVNAGLGSASASVEDIAARLETARRRGLFARLFGRS